MAERTVLTNGFFGNVGRLLAGSAGTAYAYLATDAASMSGLTASATALASECASNGFSRIAGTVTAFQTSVADDTFKITYQYTCTPAAQTIYGAGVFVGATGSTLGVFHEWALQVAFEPNDKVTETIQVQAQAG